MGQRFYTDELSTLTYNKFRGEPLLIQLYEVLAITRSKKLSLLTPS